MPDDAESVDPQNRIRCVRAVIALGSNLGDRRAFLDSAVGALASHPCIQVELVSPWMETQPVGGPAGQKDFLNGAAILLTSLAPQVLLDVLLATEARAGRVRDRRWEARTLDLDLIFYGDAVIDQSGLHVPHPRMHERLFVLRPLAIIAPDWIHPIFERSVSELLAARVSEDQSPDQS